MVWDWQASPNVQYPAHASLSWWTHLNPPSLRCVWKVLSSQGSQEGSMLGPCAVLSNPRATMAVQSAHCSTMRLATTTKGGAAEEPTTDVEVRTGNGKTAQVSRVNAKLR
jgi:hypothetical protein